MVWALKWWNYWLRCPWVAQWRVMIHRTSSIPISNQTREQCSLHYLDVPFFFHLRALIEMKGMRERMYPSQSITYSTLLIAVGWVCTMCMSGHLLSQKTRIHASFSSTWVGGGLSAYNFKPNSQYLWVLLLLWPWPGCMHHQSMPHNTTLPIILLHCTFTPFISFRHHGMGSFCMGSQQSFIPHVRSKWHRLFRAREVKVISIVPCQRGQVGRVKIESWCVDCYILK